MHVNYCRNCQVNSKVQWKCKDPRLPQEMLKKVNIEDQKLGQSCGSMS